MERKERMREIRKVGRVMFGGMIGCVTVMVLSLVWPFIEILGLEKKTLKKWGQNVVPEKLNRG